MLERPIPLALSFSLLVPLAACSGHDPGPTAPNLPAFHDVSEAPPAIQAAARAVVRIETAESMATGSFVSANGLLLTNNHVLGVDVCPIEGCFVTITRMLQRHSPKPQNETVFVLPIAVDVGLDMALVQAYASEGGVKGSQLSTPDYLTIDPRAAPSLEGARVHVIGHPEGRLKKWTSGDVIDSAGAWIQSTAFSLPGNSGSPILADDGRLVGLLHRGPASQDLLTSDGADTYSVGTASGAIAAAMSAPLPPASRSIAATVTDEEVAAHEAVYLNAHVPTAIVGAAPKPVVDSLAAVCDAGLARTDYASPEDLSAALDPCYAAIEWIDCRADAGGSAGDFRVCPASDALDAWRGRFRAVNAHRRALNGQLDLDAISFGIAQLAPTRSDGVTAAENELQQALADAKPPFDFSLAKYLAAFGVEAYGGTTTIDFVRGYSKVPHYELDAVEIVSAALWLNSHGLLSGGEVQPILTSLANDDAVDVGAKLYIELVEYNSGALD